MPDDGFVRYCPENCDPAICEEGYLIFHGQWVACGGNVTCQNIVYGNYINWMDKKCQQGPGGS